MLGIMGTQQWPLHGCPVLQIFRALQHLVDDKGVQKLYHLCPHTGLHVSPLGEGLFHQCGNIYLSTSLYPGLNQNSDGMGRRGVFP